MSLTQFAMVEELAYLIKDNLPCKHLVLSVEEMLLNHLQNCPSSDGVLELEPMNSYSRLLIHRLADIFGFLHKSVGEGDDRHLVLECCAETAIPSILVSDLLSESDKYQFPMEPHLQSSTEDPQGSTSFLREGRTAYYSPHKPLFFFDDETRESIKQKPRSDPQVARRMIAHALGCRIKPLNQMDLLKIGEDSGDQNNVVKKKGGKTSLISETYQKMGTQSAQCVNSFAERRVEKTNAAPSQTAKVVIQKAPNETSLEVCSSKAEGEKLGLRKDSLKENHVGAAKRIFAHALGFNPRQNMVSKCGVKKQSDEIEL